ncbi:MAG TPA: RNA polymerase sigma factor [Acidimicrobiia bacterium]|nr:RNA polymerase sigma factor [Acidimicrobiia bacterium]
MAEPNDIEDFYRLHAGSVYSYLVSLCRDRSLAEDLMQDTFIKATRALGGYRGGSPKAWLFSIARTVFLDKMRREARRPIAIVEVEVAGPPDRDPVEQDAIERALGALPERQRTALILSDRIELKGSEVAAILGVSEGAARVLLHRARQAFRTAYEGDAR